MSVAPGPSTGQETGHGSQYTQLTLSTQHRSVLLLQSRPDSPLLTNLSLCSPHCGRILITIKHWVMWGWTRPHSVFIIRKLTQNLPPSLSNTYTTRSDSSSNLRIVGKMYFLVRVLSVIVGTDEKMFCVITINELCCKSAWPGLRTRNN